MTLTAVLDSILRRSGLSLCELERECEEIVLFGSRASGCGSADSDWDLLCVGPRRLSVAAPLHLLWLAPAARDLPEWYGSELAGHVGRYGLWLRGSGCWRSSAHVSDEAVTRKTRGLQGDLANLEAMWRFLSPYFRRKHVTLVRRDLQRLAVLRLKSAVPPTPRLDAEWASTPSRADVLGLARELGVNERFLSEHVAPLLAVPPVGRIARDG